ncbi:O-methyltransferase [Aerococcus suis]|uniref:tRNA 5-hydroxyuridine methyltransferase n=1 Tax=Aerococcus suis TaxID=371602 RepID=A0A1W1YR21_9LACT|nr:O-methyltransferase [Aerococcus suis]MDD7758243.1 O-methyltransferase [Aerococcus suis]MDY4646672.1 O-methyltransferase [Aerococcus suis]SMC38609.1 Predicted O-methyltransferase YrrM [Aerococcus suis]
MSEKHPINEMLDRPVVMPKVLDYMRQSQKEFAEPINELENYAHENRVPIIPHETAVFLDFLLGVVKPTDILEIGMAIGFSASLMAYNHPERHVDTIDRYDQMIRNAKKNFESFGLMDQVTILEGDAKDILPELDKTYDFIFMDSAKAKYYDFFPYCMDRLKCDGLLMIDDIFQGGTVFDELDTIPKRVRKIHKKLNRLLEVIQNCEGIETTILPLGDGVLLVRKTQNRSFHNDFSL